MTTIAEFEELAHKRGYCLKKNECDEYIDPYLQAAWEIFSNIEIERYEKVKSAIYRKLWCCLQTALISCESYETLKKRIEGVCDAMESLKS